MNRPMIIASLCTAGLLGIPACATQQPGAAGYERGPASAGAAPRLESGGYLRGNSSMRPAVLRAMAAERTRAAPGPPCTRMKRT